MGCAKLSHAGRSCTECSFLSLAVRTGKFELELTVRYITHPSQMTCYAIARGHRPGVYLTWEDAKPQVDGFRNARYRKFSSGAEAEAFIEENREVGAQGDPNPIPAYYAVAKGRVPGIYGTWEEALVQVKDLFHAKYKKFSTREEAENFIEDYQKLKAADPNDPDPRNPSTLVAFCDGSAVNNGRSGCRAGWACLFPHNPTWNRAGVLVGTMVTGGIPTNNRAEYRASVEAILRANQEDPSQTKPLFIYTDSMLLVRSMTEWASKWKEQGWIKLDGEPVLNQDLLKWILQEQGPRKVIRNHVKAHTNRTDWWSGWNRRADEMAREQTSDRSL
ncbi:hypothetical protein R1sor_008443 [Riccia sorocarpa]|uniref:ribonuclease H n=1 Tax=Riccia sorocarpa TaxID=122646 RepID=A0ABD3HW93_9MARC